MSRLSRPDFVAWATSRGGLYLEDKEEPTLGRWQHYQRDILRHLFPAGKEQLPYSTIIWSDIKKSCKTELAAALHMYFALFVDIPGEQYCLANDFEGAKSRVWNCIVASLTKNPELTEGKDWQVVGNSIIFSNNSKIKAIASDYKGEAGANLSFAAVDEPWGVISPQAQRLMTEFNPVPTRPNSTVFYTGYQGWEKESVFWHTMIDNVLERNEGGEPVPELAHIEDGDGKPACWRNGRTFLLWNHQPLQPWHTKEFMAEQRKKFRGRMNEYYRTWENRRVTSTEAYCTEEQWDKLYDPGLRALHPGDRRPVILAADAATKKDCSAVVGVTWNSELQRVDVVSCKIWIPEPGAPVLLTKTVGPHIVEMHRQYRIVKCTFDFFQMAAIAEMCSAAGVKMEEFPQTSQRTECDTLLHEYIWGGNIAHYGDQALKDHVTNAVARSDPRGMRIVKELSARKIDAAVALAMATLKASQDLPRGTARMSMARNPFYG